MNRNNVQVGEEYSNRMNVLWDFVFVIVVLLSNISQLPEVVSMNATNFTAMATWFMLGVVLLVKNKFSIRIYDKALSFYKVCIIFAILVFFLGIFSDSSILNGSLFRAFIISLMVFSIGCVSGEYIDQTTIDKMELAYIISMLFVGANIYLQYLLGYDITSRIYAYGDKNSISTMLLASIVFLVFGLNSLRTIKIITLFRCLAVVFFIVLMGLLKSRASLIGLVVVLIALIMNPRVRVWQKSLVIAIVVVGIVYIANTPSIYDLVVNDILYAGRDSSSISSLSSGRTDIISNTLYLIAESPFVGLGAYYIDCFPVSAWANYGCFVGTLLIIISIYPLASSVRNWKYEPDIYYLRYTVIVLAAVFSLNSLFEGLPPFGPGIKCYILWFLFGVLCNRDSSSENVDWE